MHHLAVALVALAGGCLCWSTWRWWRALGQDRTAMVPIALYIGVIALSLGLAVSLIDRSHPAFTHAVVGLWSGLVSLVFLRRFLASPSRKLLLLPVGAMALLVAGAGLAPIPEADSSAQVIIVIHIIFMTATMAAQLIAGGAGMLYLIAVHQLKEGSALALRMPALPKLERLSERGMIVSTGLLLGGLATGGVAMQHTSTFTLTHPAAVLALLDMAILVLALALRHTGTLARRGVAWSALVAFILIALASASFIALRHG